VLGWSGAIDKDLAVLLLGILRTGLGWALRIACYGAMIWLLARSMGVWLRARSQIMAP
jgi:type IV secretory pathway TrbD component